MPEQMFAGIESLDRVNGLLHDLWFAASRIRLQGRDLVIPFASKDVSRASRAIFDSELIVRNVRSWNIHDPSRVEIYDFGRLTFDPASGRLTVEGNIPITVEADIEGELTLSLDSPA